VDVKGIALKFLEGLWRFGARRPEDLIAIHPSYEALVSTCSGADADCERFSV
jgi:hypothetical protein